MTIDHVNTFYQTRLNAYDGVLLDIFAGVKPYPINYDGGIETIKNDASADKSKIYRVQNVWPNNDRLMYWDEQLGLWSYAGNYTINDVLAIKGLVGVQPYFGTLSDLNSDTDADTALTYYVVRNSKLAEYDSVNSAWVYCEFKFYLGS